jgi:GLPGLI family protein
MKIRHLSLLLLVLLTLNTFAQDLQPVDSTKWLCTYDYEFLVDSTNKNSLRNDQMYLQIGSRLSKFTCANYYLTDSSLYLMQSKKLDSYTIIAEVRKSQKGVRNSTIAMYRIYKNYPGKGVMSFTAFDDKYYKVEQKMAMKWKLDTQNDMVILGYTCQRASISYAGRDWVAWYSPQIPLAEGPYKFNGLPGLILKISDTKNLHCFTLNAINRVTYDQPILKQTRIFVDITAEEYIKAKRNDLMRLYGDFQNGILKSNSEEGKAQAMQRIMTKNNFIEKF